MVSIAKSIPPQGTPFVDQNGIPLPIFYNFLRNLSTQAITGITGAGFVTSNGTGTFTGRAFTAGSNAITITNPTGVTGNPVFNIVQANLSIGTSQLTGTINATQLPTPTGATLGGIQSVAPVASNWINSISTLGIPALSQPAFTDISGNISVNQMNSGTSASSSTFWRGDGTWVAVGGGTGTVTSVTFTGDGTVLSSTPSSAVTTSGTVTAALKTQTKNTVLAGPTTGAAANPTFRAIVNADLPTCPALRVYLSANQSIGTGSFTKILFDTVQFDTNSNWDATNHRFTPTVAGKYQVNCQAQVAGLTVGKSAFVAIYKNGSLNTENGITAVGTQAEIAAVPDIVDMNGSTDYIEMFCYQDTGINQNVIGQPYLTYMSICKYMGT